MPLEEIAQAFRLSDYASAGAAIRNMRARLAEDKSCLRKDLNYILQDLSCPHFHSSRTRTWLRA